MIFHTYFQKCTENAFGTFSKKFLILHVFVVPFWINSSTYILFSLSLYWHFLFVGLYFGLFPNLWLSSCPYSHISFDCMLLLFRIQYCDWLQQRAVKLLFSKHRRKKIYWCVIPVKLLLAVIPPR